MRWRSVPRRASASRKSTAWTICSKSRRFLRVLTAGHRPRVTERSRRWPTSSFASLNEWKVVEKGRATQRPPCCTSYDSRWLRRPRPSLWPDYRHRFGPVTPSNEGAAIGCRQAGWGAAFDWPAPDWPSRRTRPADLLGSGGPPGRALRGRRRLLARRGRSRALRPATGRPREDLRCESQGAGQSRGRG